jgi:phosphoenolpyruvate carboxykinase (ATP)
MTPESFQLNKQRAVDYLNMRPRVFVIDHYAGWDKEYQIKTRIISARPYHALFMKNMLIRDDQKTIQKDFETGPDFTVINSGEFVAGKLADVPNQTSVNVNFTTKEQVILGTSYAGEMKKGIFGVMHYYMPQRGALSMHCSANIGPEGDTTILFGLSGTGKTTLSSDPKRSLIGDDEHVWTDTNVFNIEGGCYAKCDGLSREKEPDIFDAVKFGALVENTKFHDDENRPRTLNYDDTSLTQNTRVCYPLEHIKNVRIPAIGGHPKNVIFLTCDAGGIIPPVSRLTPEQAMYHFISGYTSKVAGTEMGVTEPVPTFSACFGEAFLPLHPYQYAEMLAEKCEKHGAKVWLINTGWVRGPFGVGSRMSLTQTRAIIDSIHDDSLDMSKTNTMRRFNMQVPESVFGVDPEILRPINCWPDHELYKVNAKKLAQQFATNFERYEAGVPRDVIVKGGPNLSF